MPRSPPGALDLHLQVGELGLCHGEAVRSLLLYPLGSRERLLGLAEFLLGDGQLQARLLEREVRLLQVLRGALEIGAELLQQLVVALLLGDEVVTVVRHGGDGEASGDEEADGEKERVESTTHDHTFV